MKMGRKNGDPNTLHSYTVTDKMPKPKPLAERKKRRGGKITITFSIPPYLYEELRLEAINSKRSLNSVAVECLEAGRVVD